MKRAVYLTETERDLAIKVLACAADGLGERNNLLGPLTKMAALWTREQVLSLKFKFEAPPK